MHEMGGPHTKNVRDTNLEGYMANMQLEELGEGFQNSLLVEDSSASKDEIEKGLLEKLKEEIRNGNYHQSLNLKHKRGDGFLNK
jgi:hypothetical protein